MSRTPIAPPTPAPDPGSRTAVAQGRQQVTKKSRNLGLPWILPALAVSVGVLYYCIGYTGYISTLKWDGASPNPISIGLNNYSKMFADPVFYKSLIHTVIFFAVTFSVQVVLGMIFAVILHSAVKLRPLYKVFIFIPVVMAPATTAPVFRQIFAPNGDFNGVLQALGLNVDYAWLANGSRH